MKTETYRAGTSHKLIVEDFSLTGDIEKFGSGFRRIRNELENYPIMELVCEEVSNGFLTSVSYSKQILRLNTTCPDKEKEVENVTESSGSRIIVLIRKNP